MSTLRRATKTKVPKSIWLELMGQVYAQFDVVAERKIRLHMSVLHAAEQILDGAGRPIRLVPAVGDDALREAVFRDISDVYTNISNVLLAADWSNDRQVEYIDCFAEQLDELGDLETALLFATAARDVAPTAERKRACRTLEERILIESEWCTCGETAQ